MCGNELAGNGDDLVRRAEQLAAGITAGVQRGDYDFAMQHDVLRIDNQLAEILLRLRLIESAIGLDTSD
jgi:hypothetical protein